MVFCLCGRACFSKTLVINGGVKNKKTEADRRPTYFIKQNGTTKVGISTIQSTHTKEKVTIESKEDTNEKITTESDQSTIESFQDNKKEVKIKPAIKVTTNEGRNQSLNEEANQSLNKINVEEEKTIQTLKSLSVINGITSTMVSADTNEEKEEPVNFKPSMKKQKAPQRPILTNSKENMTSGTLHKSKSEDNIFFANDELSVEIDKTKNISFIHKDTEVVEPISTNQNPKGGPWPPCPPPLRSASGLVLSKNNMDLPIVAPSICHPTNLLSEQANSEKNLHRESLPKLNEDAPKLSIDLELGVRERREGIAPIPSRIDENMEKLPVYIKDPKDEEIIKKSIEKNDFLNQIISQEQLNDVVAAMYNKEIASKEIIIKQGDKGSHMYVSAKGTYQIIINGKVVSEFKDTRVFGELALLYNAKRQATIKAATSGRVWVLDNSVYQQIMIRLNIKRQDELMNFLGNNEILKVVGNEALQIVANLLKSEFFKSGQVIVKQGDRGDKFYIIRAGTVTITKEGEGVVGIYKKGDCFGELALLEEDARQATVTANAPGVECLTLTRKEFIDHLGEIQKFKYIKIKDIPKDSIRSVAAEHDDINLTDLRIVKTLGVGGFGRVELVQHTKVESLVFALKYLKKIEVVQQNQQEHVYNEKVIQMGSRSPFIVRLYRTYKDTKYIYFLMESCLGGDLWSLLQKQKNRRFDEKEARFICACVLEAFDYLHSRGIVYRDLKPENLLIASNGYIKLTDFGFAKKISGRGKTYTFAGTPEYVAPEIVLNRGHDKAVDYWAFGAFIFEMTSGRTPFRTDDSSHMRTYNKILKGIDSIQFPTYINLKARHLIEKLCRPVPSERLGMQRHGIQDIKSHKWFLGLDWQKLGRGEMSSPFKPKLTGPIDTRYFDHFKRDADNPPEELSGWDEKF